MNIPFDSQPIPGPKPWYGSPEEQLKARKELHQVVSRAGR